MAGTDNDDVYVLDSSSWISIEGHPAQDAILYRLLKLIEAGRIVSPPEVWDELKKCDWVLAWIGDKRKQIVRSFASPDYFALIGQVASAYPSMCATRGSKDKGDGYVVASVVHGSRTSNPQRWIGVAEDEAIRTACSEYQQEAIDLAEMMSREFPDESWP
jgi:hypothetical protein